jgi:hypothetical protein
MEYRNHTLTEPVQDWSGGDSECMDSSQMWFCRDLWMNAAREPMVLKKEDLATASSASSTTTALPTVAHPTSAKTGEASTSKGTTHAKRAEKPLDAVGRRKGAFRKEGDGDAGSDADAMQGGSPPPMSQPAASDSDVYVRPNSQYRPARILINPRCVTTYAGVSHTQLALHLFGPDKGEGAQEYDSKQYVLDKKEWMGAPDSFVCQEQKCVAFFPLR